MPEQGKVNPLLKLLRLPIIFFWLAVVFLFLFFPSVRMLWQPQKAINIMTWADLIDPDIVQSFEDETGIKVHLSYFESNDELYTRFKATRGKGHDLILPSDFLVQTLIEDDLLKPLDKSKLQFWSQLDPRLLNLFHDPANKYSIPFYWAIYGIGYNKRVFEKEKPSMRTIFDNCSPDQPLFMSESAREAVLIAAYHLFGSIDDLDEQKLEKVKELLLRQKKCVGAYSETRADYLLITEEFFIGIVPSAIIWRTLKEYPYLGFVTPEKGRFVMIDNFAIPKASKREDLVYEFLNFMYRPENIRLTFEQIRFLPATVNLIPLLKEYGAPESIIKAHSSDPATWQFFKNIIASGPMEDVWIALKAK